MLPWHTRLPCTICYTLTLIEFSGSRRRGGVPWNTRYHKRARVILVWGYPSTYGSFKKEGSANIDSNMHQLYYNDCPEKGTYLLS